MLADWNILSNETQMTLARAALQRAAASIAGQAELLADEIETGGMTDPGGADALRLLAAVVRGAQKDRSPWRVTAEPHVNPVRHHARS